MNYEIRSASVFRRIAAFIIDLLIIFFISFILVLFISKTTYGILLVLLFVFKDVLAGQSVGKRLLKIYVRSGENFDKTPGLQALALRNLSTLLIWYVDVILVLFNREHRKLGDLLVGTKVVTIEPIGSATGASGYTREPQMQAFNQPTYDANAALGIDMTKWDSLKDDLQFNKPVSKDVAHNHIKIARKRKIDYNRDYVKENDWE